MLFIRFAGCQMSHSELLENGPMRIALPVDSGLPLFEQVVVK